MKAVVYALSPYQQKVMHRLWKNLPVNINHKITDNWLNTILLLGPVIGTYTYVIFGYYAQNCLEMEKLHHR